MKSTLQIISITQARVDAFLKEIFDICESSEDCPTTKSLSDTIATEIAIFDAVEAVIRRRRNEHALLSRLATDIVHSIFGIALDVDRIHDLDLPSDALEGNSHQLERMRRVSAATTSVIERSASAPLCVRSFSGSPPASSIRLVPATRVQAPRSNESDAYHLYRQFLQNPMPALETLGIQAQPRMRDDPSEPSGNLPSIHQLTAQWWQPPADAAWLTGLKELLPILSADELVVGELPDAISPITLPRLRSICLKFRSNESMVKLIRRLIAPQCLRHTLHVNQARNLGLDVADYGRFMSVEERCTEEYPKSADIPIQISFRSTHLEYKTESLQIVFDKDRSEDTRIFLKSLGDQSIQIIVAHLRYTWSYAGHFLKPIGARLADLPGLDGLAVTNTTTDWPFKSLRLIEIHDTLVSLSDFTELVEEYLHKDPKPVLEEIVLVNCSIGQTELTEAAERLARIGITIQRRHG
ncbi:hypothetical protein M407DRAFT_20011 [Tulasnella calospora MUT 4182]|uniref:Uncharacterized protein n=1 Tax=Tulasnella calospora MUT 4182 TaxID=1051891 RepID=A0A0C3QGS7_9AGAM|nr:hypothetical protein M407DRAFT_20011 [Tulasnella calospora MUT 4182]